MGNIKVWLIKLGICCKEFLSTFGNNPKKDIIALEVLLTAPIPKNASPKNKLECNNIIYFSSLKQKVADAIINNPTPESKIHTVFKKL